MSETLMVALIGGISLILNTVIGAVLAVILVNVRRTRKVTVQTNDNITNHHETNFRIENDERHAETRQWFWSLWNKIGGVEKNLHSRIDKLASGVDDLTTGFLENRERIENIEDTQAGGKKNV